MNAGLPVWRLPGSGANPLDPNDDTCCAVPPRRTPRSARSSAFRSRPASFWEYPEDIQIFGLSAATNICQLVGVGRSELPGGHAGAGQRQRPARRLLGFARPERDGRPRGRAAGRGGYPAATTGSTSASSRSTPSRRSATCSAPKTCCSSAKWARSGTTCRTTPRTTCATAAASCSASARTRCARAECLPGGRPVGDTVFADVRERPGAAREPFYNPQPDGCKNDGYVTDFAWGYRLRLNRGLQQRVQHAA